MYAGSCYLIDKEARFLCKQRLLLHRLGRLQRLLQLLFQVGHVAVVHDDIFVVRVVQESVLREMFHLDPFNQIW